MSTKREQVSNNKKLQQARDFQLYLANLNSLFKRIDSLFKVVELSDKFPKEFVNEAILELVALIKKPDEANKCTKDKVEG